MKLYIILIYATFILYANLSFSHERKDLEYLQEILTGPLQKIILNKKPIKVQEITIVDINNVSKTIDFKDKNVTLINFWATWCAPCREEMPSLNDLVQSINSDAFSIIVIAAGRNSNDAIQDFFETHKLTNLKSYKDPKGKIASRLSVFGLPTTIIVDQHSNELARLIGSTDWNSKDSIEFINRILNH